MKKLRKMKVINWHYFDEDEISFGSATMLSGHSGAGKSTLLDALQYLFIGSQTQTRFNAAATQEARRTLVEYLRGKIKAEGVQYLRADEFTSYIALEFYDDIKKISFIVGYVVDAFHDDRLDEEFFLLDQRRLSAVEFRSADGVLYTREAFHRRYAHGSSVFETGKRQWQKRLMNRLGQLSARFLPAFSRALAFRPIDQVREFIYEYILLPRDLKLDVLREVFESYQRFERDLKGLRAKRLQLEKLKETYDTYCKWRDTFGAGAEYRHAAAARTACGDRGTAAAAAQISPRDDKAQGTPGTAACRTLQGLCALRGTGDPGRGMARYIRGLSQYAAV